MKVLSYDGAWCMTVSWARGTSDEDIMLYSGWQNAKVCVINVFTCIP
jgi:hypothetical protein